MQRNQTEVKFQSKFAVFPKGCFWSHMLLLVLITYHRERIRAWCAKSSMISCKLPSPTEETEISNFESETTLSGQSCSPAGRLSSQSSKFLGGSGVFGLLFFCSCLSSSSYWARIACTRGSIDAVESECYLDELILHFGFS